MDKIVINPGTFTMSLTAFCQNCFENDRPNPKDKILVYGHDSQEFKLIQVESFGKSGFTPHVIYYCGTEDEKIVYCKACGICGITLYFDSDCLKFKTKDLFLETMFLEDWGSWIQYKDPTYII